MIFPKLKTSKPSTSLDDKVDDILVATAMDGDSDDEQLIVGKKKQKSKSNAWIDEEADDDDEDDEFKGNSVFGGGISELLFLINIPYKFICQLLKPKLKIHCMAKSLLIFGWTKH